MGPQSTQRKDSTAIGSKAGKSVTFGDNREQQPIEIIDDSPTTVKSVKPNFVKHINKTRTMSGRQKWDWAFDKILMVSTCDK